jgi:amidophosphoribosyltransferase
MLRYIKFSNKKLVSLGHSIILELDGDLMAISLVYHSDTKSNCYIDLGIAVFDMSHAGQESHTLSVSDGKRIESYDDSGIINIVKLGEGPRGFVGVGRNSSRYGVEPTVPYCSKYGDFSLAFDGYLLNGDELREKRGGKNDAELAARFIADANDFEKGVENLAGETNGHFCITFATEKGEAYGARSPLGVRTLIYGHGDKGHALVSESRALSHIGMIPERDLYAGEIVAISGSGLHTLKQLPSKKKVCSFLWPYYQMVDCVVEGIPVAIVKERIGAYHGRKDKKTPGIEIDVACPVPDSGKDYEEAYAREFGCKHAEILKKYPYAGRSYDRPDQFFRDLIARVKITVIPHKAEGKKIALLEDSIRRGTQIIREGGPIDLLVKSGAEEINPRICSPRNEAYCRCSPPEGERYEDETLAANRFPTDENLANYLRAKSVGFIDTDSFVNCIIKDSNLKREELCLGCYDKDFSFLGIDL